MKLINTHIFDYCSDSTSHHTSSRDREERLDQLPSLLAEYFIDEIDRGVVSFSVSVLKSDNTIITRKIIGNASVN